MIIIITVGSQLSVPVGTRAVRITNLLMYILFVSYRFIEIFAGRSFEHLRVMLKEYHGDIESRCFYLKDGLCFTVGMCATFSFFLPFLLKNP